MAENIEKLEAKIKALQAKKREATKQAKAKQQKAEFERLKAVEKEYVLLQESTAKKDARLKDYDLILSKAKELGWSAKDLFEFLKQEASKKNQEQNN